MAGGENESYMPVAVARATLSCTNFLAGKVEDSWPSSHLNAMEQSGNLVILNVFVAAAHRDDRC